MTVSPCVRWANPKELPEEAELEKTNRISFADSQIKNKSAGRERDRKGGFLKYWREGRKMYERRVFRRFFIRKHRKFTRGYRKFRSLAEVEVSKANFITFHPKSRWNPSSSVEKEEAWPGVPCHHWLKFRFCPGELLRYALLCSVFIHLLTLKALDWIDDILDK